MTTQICKVYWNLEENVSHNLRPNLPPSNKHQPKFGRILLQMFSKSKFPFCKLPEPKCSPHFLTHVYQLNSNNPAHWLEVCSGRYWTIMGCLQLSLFGVFFNYFLFIYLFIYLFFNLRQNNNTHRMGLILVNLCCLVANLVSNCGKHNPSNSYIICAVIRLLALSIGQNISEYHGIVQVFIL